MAKIELDKYYTDDSMAKYCIDKTFEVLGDSWDRIIEPSAGTGAFLKYLPSAIAYDIEPVCANVIKADYRDIDLPHIDRSLVIGNPPFGRANKLSVQFIKSSMKHSDYVSFIQPISQLNQNRTMKDTELLYSEDLGPLVFSGHKVHCCLNIYHKCVGGHKQDFSIPGVRECRHIFRTGKMKHNDNILNYPWTHRVAAWGTIKLLSPDETASNEVVFDVEPQMCDWITHKLQECDYESLVSCVSTPNLPAWRLLKWLKEQYSQEENKTDEIQENIH